MLLNDNAFLLCFLGVCNLHGFSLCSRVQKIKVMIFYLYGNLKILYIKKISIFSMNNISYIILEKF
jgi:hypothetical protein